MSECPHCRKKVESSATRCNHCGGEFKDQLSDVIKNGAFKQYLIGILIMGVVAMFVALIGFDKTVEQSFYIGLISMVVLFGTMAGTNVKK
jgi:hypothetical protein